MTTEASITPKNSMEQIARGEKISLSETGGRSMAPSVRSMPSARTGRESVIRLTQSSCVDVRKSYLHRKSVTMNTESTSAKLVDRKKEIVFLMLKKTLRPSSTARTIVEKSSSAMTTSAAFFVTSVPEPIATPTPTPRPSDEPQEEGGAQDATEEAPQATVEILKAPELLSSDEAAAFNALGLRERMLSFLAAVGYEDQVDAALTASGEQLSQAAIAAREQLAQRIAAMDEAQKSEFDAWMTASFEPATVEVGGASYGTLLLEVVRVEGDSVEVRRYGFLDGDVWSFGERPLTAEEIAAAQNGLNARGYDCGAADGIAGPNTEAAARAFQGADVYGSFMGSPCCCPFRSRCCPNTCSPALSIYTIPGGR